MAVFLLIGLLVVVLPSLYANPSEVTSTESIALDAAVDETNLASRAWLLEDPDGKLTLDQIIKPEISGHFHPGSPSIGFSTSAWWLRFQISNPTDRPIHKWFDTGDRRSQEIDFYLQNDHEGWVHQSASSNTIFNDRPLPTDNFVFPIEVPEKFQGEIYLRIRSFGANNLTPSPVIWNKVAYLNHEADDLKILLSMGGASVALAVFNLALYFFSRDSTYALYSLAVFSILFGGLSGHGGFGPGYRLLWPEHPLFNQLMWSLSTIFTAFPLFFIEKFLDTKRVWPKLHRFLHMCIGLLAIAVFIQMYFSSKLNPIDAAIAQHAYQLGVVFWLPIYPAMLFLIVRCAQAGNRSAKFLVVSYLPIVLAMVYLAVSAATGRVISYYPLIAAYGTEFMIMSLAIADRYDQMRRFKEAAQDELIQVLRTAERALEEKVLLRTQELQIEQARSKALLNNMLPSKVAEELSATGITRPIRHESVTILFTDLGGFTHAASTMPPDRMLAELNDIFAAFDQITDKCGVEKIKTIGDAYMAAAGVPEACIDHAQRCVRAGLEMVSYIAQRNLEATFKWVLRVGIHTGPVVAGVVGKKRYAFDVWGDTVNIAARMESSSEPGRVNISAYTFDLIRSEYDCEYRGKVEAKGKGEMDMYFVVGSLKPLGLGASDLV